MRVLLYALLGCLALGGSATDGSCGPVLNEILAGPARDWDGNGVYSSRDDEWLELYNPGPGSVTLDGYLIGDEASNPLYGFSGTLEAGQCRVVYGSDAVEYQRAYGLNIYGLRLANDGDTVTLLQVSGTDTTLADSYSYNSYEAGSDRSTGRYPDGTSTWQIFDQLNPYTGQTPPLGNGLPPTPGTLNGGGSPPVAVLDPTWGKIRSLYRRG